MYVEVPAQPHHRSHLFGTIFMSICWIITFSYYLNYKGGYNDTCWAPAWASDVSGSSSVCTPSVGTVNPYPNSS